MQHKKLYGALGLLLVIVIIATALLVSHSKSPTMTMSSGTTPQAVASNTVTIQNYMFSPMAIKVKVGTTVTWTNHDSVNHTVTADTPSASAPSSMDIATNKSYSFTFTKAGTYTYHCFPHPYMHGTVEVTN